MSKKFFCTMTGACVLGASLLSGCSSTQTNSWAFEDEGIRSILVAPVISESTQVGSDMLMYSTATFPIAEKGYYPYPVETVKMVLEQEGLYEPERVYQMDSAKLASMFGADAVLKIKVNEWDAQYAVFNTTIFVDADYALYKADGTELWQDKAQYAWRSDGGQTQTSLLGLLVAATAAAIHRSAPDFRPAVNGLAEYSVRLWKPGPTLREELATQTEKKAQETTE